MEVDEVISEDVVRGIPLNTNIGRLVFKFFPPDSARLLSEIFAYKALQPVQGSAVPKCLGDFTIDRYKYALGLSAVDGVTLRQHLETEQPSMEWSQLCAVYDCGIAHQDVRAENILMKHGSIVCFRGGIEARRRAGVQV